MEKLLGYEDFSTLNDKFIEYYRKYANLFELLDSKSQENVVRKEYSKGGESLKGGFYSFSQLDLVIIGLRRGRLLKRPPKKDNYTYEYYFDSNDDIIRINRYGKRYDTSFGIWEIQFLIKEENHTISLSFHYDFKTLEYITDTIFRNGKPIRYEAAIVNSYEDDGSIDCYDMHIEEFYYENDFLKSFRWYSTLRKDSFLQGYEYILSRDEEGYFTNYTVEDLFYPGDEPQEYKTLGKRK